MTRVESARRGIITDEIKEVAEKEGITADYIRQGLADGTIVITQSVLRRSIKPLAIGKGLRTKINANIGTSGDMVNVEEEMEKLRVAVKAGADAIMDLSTGGDISRIRKMILKECPVPVGTVPVYEAAKDAKKKDKSFVELKKEDFFEAVERHAEDGVDFITVHSGITKDVIKDKDKRVMGIVSRGGALIAEWMKYNGKENPFYEDFPRLIKIAKKYDMLLSLGDGLRPGSILDATDAMQIGELKTLGELAEAAKKQGVSVIIEGPGHVPIDEIGANIMLEKKLCNGSPFYVLGPLVTDIAPGYDHITGAIGGALAAAYGADFLCYVTPSEHLRLPTVEDVRMGVIASRIAAHAGDIAKKIPSSLKRDLEMSRARKSLNWEEQIRLSIDPDAARAIRALSPPEDKEVCTMCGSLCAIKIGGKG